MAYPKIELLVNTAGLDAITAHMRERLVSVVGIAAGQVETRAKQLVPVDTGATKNSIQQYPSDGGLVVAIGPSTSYAPYLEFGTRFMSARPYMTPALESVRFQFLEAVRQVMEGKSG